MRQICFYLLLLFKTASAQPTINWNEYFLLQGKNCYAIDYKLDSQGNVIIALNVVDSSTSESRPGIIKYNQSGNFEWQWFSSDSLFSVADQLELDNNDNPYLLTWRENNYQNHLVKLDGTNGLELFNHSCDTSFYSGAFTIDSSNIYIAQSAPDLLITNLDLNGNFIASIPLDFIQKIHCIRKINNEFVIIADSLTSTSANLLVMHKLNQNGNYQIKQFSNMSSPNFHDFATIGDSLYFVTGNTDASSCPYLICFKINGFVWDTLPCISGGIVSTAKLVTNNNKLFWSYIYGVSSGTFNSINLIENFNSNLLTTIDSCRHNDLDIEVNSSNLLYTINANRGTTNPLQYDYEVNAFDATGNLLLWSFRFTKTLSSKDMAKFIKFYNNSLYIVGDVIDNFPGGLSQINIMKLSNVTNLNPIECRISHNLFPNPNYGRIFNLSIQNENSIISVYDLNGNLLFSTDYIKEGTLNIPNLTPGVYIFKISNKTKTQFQKIILY